MKHVSTGRWFIIAVLVIMSILSALVGLNLAVSSSGAASSRDIEASSRHRDCVTNLQNARRAVYDNVDIYKAVLIQAATDRQLGLPLQGNQDYYRGIDTNLTSALTEARRLQPASTLNHLIARGGTIDGVKYPACPN